MGKAGRQALIRSLLRPNVATEGILRFFSNEAKSFYVINHLKKEPCHTSFDKLRTAGFGEDGRAIRSSEGAKYGAEEGTRTPILLTGLDPEPSVSTNFTTSAYKSVPPGTLYTLLRIPVFMHLPSF